MNILIVALLAAGLLVGAIHPGLAAPPLLTKADGYSRLVVSPAGPYTSIQAALQAARDGDAILVQPGIYPGELLVNKSVTLEGTGYPVIDGGGQGTVVTLAAPQITFKGFTVRGSGVEPDRDHAGITVTAPDVTVENNRLEDVLFGIFVAEADRTVVRSNDITSKTQYDLGRKGDAIRIWYSQDAILEANHVHDARDVVLWYAKNVILRDNRIENGRYGVHLMYCNGAQIVGNRMANNSVGAYVMYSSDVIVRQNDIRGHHGASGYALGFKDADDILVAENLLVDNHAGAFLDGTPYSPQGFARFQDNIFAFNNIAVSLTPAVHHAEFSSNTFWENVEQLAIQGGGQGQNDWHSNYWSDYSGFDLQGDGQGDIPYHSERFFESLTDREPLLRVLIYSPAAQAVEMAAAAFPIFKPQPKLIDAAPSMQASALPALSASQAVSRSPLILASAAVLAVGLAIGLAGLGLPRRPGLTSTGRIKAAPEELHP